LTVSRRPTTMARISAGTALRLFPQKSRLLSVADEGMMSSTFTLWLIVSWVDSRLTVLSRPTAMARIAAGTPTRLFPQRSRLVSVADEGMMSSTFTLWLVVSWMKVRRTILR